MATTPKRHFGFQNFFTLHLSGIGSVCMSNLRKIRAAVSECISGQTNRQTDKQTDRQTDKRTRPLSLAPTSFGWRKAKIDDNEQIGSLLWADDVVLASDNPEELQEMLDITNKTALKYHVEFGKDKSQVMIIKYRAIPP